MAEHFTENDIAEFYEVFRQFDKDRNGQLPLQHMPEAMLSLGHNPTEEELEKLIQTVKKDPERKYFDFPEFLTILALHIHETEPEEQLREAFKVFDKEGKGTLSAKELKMTMALLGEQMSQEDIDYMITTADIDGDGLVNYEEFIRIMTSK